MIDEENRTAPAQEGQPGEEQTPSQEEILEPLEKEGLPEQEKPVEESGKEDLPEREKPIEAAEEPVPTTEETVYPEEIPVSPAPNEQAPSGAGAPFVYEAPPQAPVQPQGVPAYPPYGYAQPPQAFYTAQPMYGQPCPPQSVPPQNGPVFVPQPGQFPQPQWSAGQQAPYAPYPYAPGYPPKKKMSTGLKVFIIVASILAGLAVLGFGGYLIYNAASSQNSVSNSLPWNGSELPGGNQYEFPFTNPDSPDEDDTPDFDDDVTPPDSGEPLPDVDVTPNHEGITINKEPAGRELSAQEVYEKVVKSTVTVAVTLEKGGVEQKSTGTGIIATSDGYIITNAHVVLNSKSSRVEITTADGEKYDAVVVGMDRTTDLAVLKTNDHNFTSAEFGDADQLVIGDSVIAIGNPGGEKFSGSMTGGYVSGLDRAVGKYSENGMTYLQTDAAINPGNSGGPLVNMYGQVVGINSSKIISDGYEGMGFAIPVNKAQSIINELLAGGYVKGRVRLGITGMDTSNDYRYAMMGAPEGFVISEINEDSAFAGTDAKEGDIITAIDGDTVTCLEEISNLLLKYAPGDQITVTLYRMSSGIAMEERELEVTITLLEDKGETQK